MTDRGRGLRLEVIPALLVAIAVSFQPAGAQSRRVMVADEAAQTLIAGRSETLDILFRDGTSVLVGPGGTIRTRVGESIEIESSAALLRIASGQPGLARPVQVTTPHATLRLTSGSGVVTVAGAVTQAFLLIDGDMSVEAGGRRRDLYRAGYEVVATAAGPGRPRRMSEDEIVDALDRVSPGLGSAPQAMERPAGIVSQNAAALSPPLVASLGAPDGIAAREEAELGDVCDPASEASAGGANCLLALNRVTNGGVETQPTADFATGFGGLGLANLYDLSTEPISLVAQGVTSISDDPPFDEETNVPFVFQSFGEPIGDTFEDAIANAGGSLIGYVSSDDFGERQRARAAGPTTNVLVPGDTWQDFADAGNASDLFAEVSGGERRYGKAFRYVFGALDFSGFGGSESPQLGLTESETRFTIIEGETIALEKSGGQPNIFTLSEAINGSRGGFAFDFAGPFNGRGDDNFLIVEVFEASESSRHIFAAGDLDGLVTGSPDTSFELSFNPGVATMDRFSLVAGLGAYFPGVPRPQDTRGFLPAETWLDLMPADDASLRDVTDSGLLVVNPAVPLVDVTGLDSVAPGTVVPGGADSRLLHADFGLKRVGERQVSSISASIGEVDFRLYAEEQLTGVTLEQLVIWYDEFLPGLSPDEYLNLSVDAVLSARTVGSSNDGTRAASTLAFSDWTSTAAGGGNPDIDSDRDGDPDPGRLGFFVLQNAGSTIDDVVSDERVSFDGGRFKPVGNDPARPDQAFGALRLGIATTDNTRELTATNRRDDRFGDPGGRGLIGYAQGLVESENGTSPQVGLAPLMRIADGSNLAIAVPDTAANTITAALTVAGLSEPIAFGGTGEIYGRTVELGTFVDDLSWGMLSNEEGTAMAMISAEPVARELRGQFNTSDGREVPIPARDAVGKLGAGIDDAYDYVQWGFFFGDVIDTDGSRQHVHLGTFAAGSPIDPSVLATAKGEATYRGHAIGNVYNGGDVYTSVGTFSDKFNFDTKTGITAMDFDRRSYGGSSRLAGGVYAGTVARGDRSGTLNGRFVGGMSGGQPNALVGGFELQNNESSRDSAYRAIGTFGAEK